MLSDRLKAGIDRCSTQLWALSFTGLGGLHPRRESWRPTGGQRVLVVAPHPDDEAAGCAGTLLNHLRGGDEVAVAWVTDGGKSRALGLPGAEIAVRRRQEARAAAAALGVTRSYWYGLSEGAWDSAELALNLQQSLAEFEPEIVYAPSIIDFHPEHRLVAKVLATVLPTACEVRIFQIQVPLTALLTNVLVDVTDQITEIVAVFRLYETQRSSLERLLRTRRYAGCYYRAGKYLEEFWQLSAVSYKRLHSKCLGFDSFRGLRYRSITDPLAYCQARALRRQARTIAALP
jgi:LmbE family N-acetylglucosaminyl deacetylase